MKRILILYYSQSGDVARAAAALVAPLEWKGAEIIWRRIEPQTPYPYPWKTFDRFFDVFPESVLGDAPPIRPLHLAGERFDLIVFAWQVWFLSPSLPVQGFFRSPDAEVLKNAPVVTLSVSRNTRHVASRRMSQLLTAAGADHVGEVAITHEGPPLATFLTTPRTLLTGRRDRMWGVLPSPGVADRSLNSLERLGEAISVPFFQHGAAAVGPLLAGGRASPVNWGYLASECAGWPLFVAWAHLVRYLARFGPAWRRLGLQASILSLLLGLIVLIPLGLAVSPLVLAYSRWRAWTSTPHVALR